MTISLGNMPSDQGVVIVASMTGPICNHDATQPSGAPWRAGGAPCAKQCLDPQGVLNPGKLDLVTAPTP
jgi:hypothetical protein